jgi:hypothetical protein
MDPSGYDRFRTPVLGDAARTLPECPLREIRGAIVYILNDEFALSLQRALEDKRIDKDGLGRYILA